MTQVYEVTVDGIPCSVTVSDENEALQAAHAAGGAILGIWREEGDTSGFGACLYLVTSEEDITEQLLERTARRHLDLPWHIAETERLSIREFAAEDPLEPESKHDGDGVFSDWGKREAYRKSQYRFGECGLWALVRKDSGKRELIIGKAGITDGELGYHIYPEFQGMGYAKEACRAILCYAQEEQELGEVFLRTEKSNTVSIHLAKLLGFVRTEETETQYIYRKKL